MSLTKKLGVASFAVIMSIGVTSTFAIADGHRGSSIEGTIGSFFDSDENGPRGRNVAAMLDSEAGDYAVATMAYERCKVRNPDDYMTTCEYWGELPLVY